MYIWLDGELSARSRINKRTIVAFLIVSPYTPAYSIISENALAKDGTVLLKG